MLDLGSPIRNTASHEELQVLYKQLNHIDITGVQISLQHTESMGRTMLLLIFAGGSNGKVSAYNAVDPGSIPRSGRSPGEGNGNPLQYSCLENPMDGGTR